MYLLVTILLLPYFVLLLEIFLNLLRLKPHESGTGTASVSVVVACRDEQERLPRLLENLEKQDYPTDLFEIIVVDDNSHDRTAIIASEYQGRLKLKLLPSQGSGKKMALRTGISSATGELIITTDADCKPGSSWLRTVASFYDKHKPALIVIPVKLPPSRGFTAGLQELDFLSLQGITAGAVAGGHASICNGANLAFSKREYDNISLPELRFDIQTGDDVFLLHALKRSGRTIMWLESQDACVTTEPAKGLTAFLKQRIRWASKVTAYRDFYSSLLGIVTFVTNLSVSLLLVASLLDPRFFPVYLTSFMIKSVPDSLILFNVTGRYARRRLMRWFLPAQLVYPFYVIGVSVSAILKPRAKSW